MTADPAPEPQLIDTHTHVVSPNPADLAVGLAPMPNGAWWEGVDASAESLGGQLAAAGVEAALLVQASGPHGTDNSYMATSAATDPHRFAGVCTIDALAPDAIDRLRHLGGLAQVHGVRLFHVFPERPWLDQARGLELVDAATELSLTVGVCVQAHDLGRLGALLHSRPELTVVLDHCGLVDFSQPGSAEVQELWRVLDHPGLHLKFTPTVATGVGDTDACGALLADIVARAGTDRVVWGSDWPQHRDAEGSQTVPYADTVAWLQACVGDLEPTAQRAVVGANALRLWPEAWPDATVRA